MAGAELPQMTRSGLQRVKRCCGVIRLLVLHLDFLASKEKHWPPRQPDEPYLRLAHDARSHGPDDNYYAGKFAAGKT